MTRCEKWYVTILLGMFMGGTVGAEVARPNILFCIADDASYPHMGAYGCSWVKTPGFDRVARDGVLFRNAYTPNAKCAPSRACILTGRNSWQLEEAANHFPFFPAKFRTYPETLGAQGYSVGYTGKGWSPGDPGQVDGKRRQLCGPAYLQRKTKPPARGIASHDYAANFADFLDERPTDKPFCFWYGALEPHRGYEYGSGVKKGGKALKDVDRVFGFWPDREITRHDMLDYAFEIEWFDLHLQRMLADLEKRGLLQNTLVVVTSDHGMPFPRVKGQAYELSNHIPLAVMWPQGIQHPGRVVDDFISFIDLAPTFIELAEVTTSGMQPIQGRSLMPLLQARQGGAIDPQRDHVLIGKERHDIGRPHDWGYPIRGIRKGSYLYVQNFETDRWPAGHPETGYLNCDGGATKTEILEGRRQKRPGDQRFWDLCFGKRPGEELYRVDLDFDCIHNLAEDPALQAIKAQLREQLYAELKQQGDPRMFGKGHVFDEYPYSSKANRGFYERFKKGEKIKAGWVNRSDFETEPIE